MKNIVFALSMLVVVLSCTTYEENIKKPVQNYRTLTLENINTDLKVANLIVDIDEFENMYQNFNEDIEIEGILNMYKNNEPLLEDEVIEIEIKGIFSASLELKSLGIKFNDTYDNSQHKLINPKTLPFHSVEKIKAFRFRNSGSDFGDTMLKDLAYTKLAINAGLNLDLSYAEQVVVFVNNEFFGVMNMRTEANTNGVSKLYDVKKKNITLAKIKEGGIVEKKDGDFDRIDRFLEAIASKNYDDVINEIDKDNFIDYIIYESYIGNRDWPKNNVRFFAIDDGLFRFILFDLDLVSTQNIDASPFAFINNSIENPITDLFNILYANASFKNSYDARFNFLMNSNLLSADKFDVIVATYKNNIEHIMPTQIEKYSFPKTLTDWYFNLEELKSNFKKRENYVKK